MGVATAAADAGAVGDDGSVRVRVPGAGSPDVPPENELAWGQLAGDGSELYDERVSGPSALFREGANGRTDVELRDGRADEAADGDSTMEEADRAEDRQDAAVTGGARAPGGGAPGVPVGVGGPGAAGGVVLEVGLEEALQLLEVAMSNGEEWQLSMSEDDDDDEDGEEGWEEWVEQEGVDGGEYGEGRWRDLDEGDETAEDGEGDEEEDDDEEEWEEYDGVEEEEMANEGQGGDEEMQAADNGVENAADNPTDNGNAGGEVSDMQAEGREAEVPTAPRDVSIRSRRRRRTRRQRVADGMPNVEAEAAENGDSMSEDEEGEGDFALHENGDVVTAGTILAATLQRLLEHFDVRIDRDRGVLLLGHMDAANQPFVGNPADYLDRQGLENFLQMVAANDSSRQGPPPASRAAIEALTSVQVTLVHLESGQSVCAVCKESGALEETLTQLPCNHLYHEECILPWLATRNSCPLCRFELPTDDPDYESQRQSERQPASPPVLLSQTAAAAANAAEAADAVGAAVGAAEAAAEALAEASRATTAVAGLAGVGQSMQGATGASPFSVSELSSPFPRPGREPSIAAGEGRGQASEAHLAPDEPSRGGPSPADVAWDEPGRDGLLLTLSSTTVQQQQRRQGHSVSDSGRRTWEDLVASLAIDSDSPGRPGGVPVAAVVEGAPVLLNRSASSLDCTDWSSPLPQGASGKGAPGEGSSSRRAALSREGSISSSDPVSNFGLPSSTSTTVTAVGHCSELSLSSDSFSGLSMSPSRSLAGPSRTPSAQPLGTTSPAAHSLSSLHSMPGAGGMSEAYSARVLEHHREESGNGQSVSEARYHGRSLLPSSSTNGMMTAGELEPGAARGPGPFGPVAPLALSWLLLPYRLALFPLVILCVGGRAIAQTAASMSGLWGGRPLPESQHQQQESQSVSRQPQQGRRRRFLFF
eukprot:TRINITY_DN18092_c0_g1_i1.p1 TRINITY_DN18092_c0_g1~~TRINITY_DN18092_c0_g1_i1.p1  ORF type:complete len:1044 (-),score=226.55 TRINITY_DN18092_c0_g1_i1:1113-3914(-)